MTILSYLIRLNPEQVAAINRVVSIGLGEPQHDIPEGVQQFFLDRASSLSSYDKDCLKDVRDCLRKSEFWLMESRVIALDKLFGDIKAIEVVTEGKSGLSQLVKVLEDVNLYENYKAISGGGVNPSTGLYEIWMSLPPKEPRLPNGWVVVSKWQLQRDLFSEEPTYAYEVVPTAKAEDLGTSWDLASEVFDTQEEAEAAAQVKRRDGIAPRKLSP